MRLLRSGLYTVVALALLAAALRIIRTGDWADAATWVIVAAFAGYSAMLDRRVDRLTREGTARAALVDARASIAYARASSAYARASSAYARASSAYARGYRDGLKHDADTLDQE